jgi:O-antigen/teichoic acid export membrane protein
MAEVKQHNRGKKFVKDFGVYAIGVLGSKLITFLMVPLYTYFIEKPSDYGYYDMCLQVCLLLIPVVTLQLRDGAYRFLLVTDNEDKRNRIISSSLNMLFISILFIISAAFVISLFKEIPYLSYTIALLVMMSICEVSLQIVRGLGYNKVFVAANLIATFSIGILSVIFVAILSLGIKGIFLANIIARLVMLVYSELRIRFLRYYKVHIDFKKTGKELLKYAIPLIPVAVCWWLTSSANRFFIKHYLGWEIAGIYAASVRLTSLLHTIGIIFYQTWQENAIQQYNSKDRDSFFSKVFNSYFAILTILQIVYVFGLKFIFPWIVSSKYQEGAEYIYSMGVSMLFFTLTSYFDLGYQCAKETHRAILSIVLTAILCLILNFFLVQVIGIYGIILSSIISYLFLLIYRYFDTRRYFKLSLNRELLVYISLLISAGIVYYINLPIWADMLFIILVVVVFLTTVPIGELKSSILKKKRR